MHGTRTWVIVVGAATLLSSCATPRIHYTEPTGREMYMTYCAPCHGEDGKGGPAEARKLADGRADLTALSRRNGGKFPADRIRLILGGLEDIPAQHGPHSMPIWADLFDTRSNTDRARANEQFDTLAAYLESIQRK